MTRFLYPVENFCSSSSTYAPVAKMTSIWTILAYTNHCDYELISFDIKTAFLHAKLTLDIYCKQIPVFPEADPHTVLGLLVVLYGLWQSSYKFYMLLLKIMTHLVWFAVKLTLLSLAVDGHLLHILLSKCLLMVNLSCFLSPCTLTMVWLPPIQFPYTIGSLPSCARKLKQSTLDQLLFILALESSMFMRLMNSSSGNRMRSSLSVSSSGMWSGLLDSVSDWTILDPGTCINLVLNLVRHNAHCACWQFNFCTFRKYVRFLWSDNIMTLCLLPSRKYLHVCRALMIPNISLSYML